MKVLVTGAGGFLGREVVRATLGAGHHVVAMVRPRTTVETLGWGDAVEVLRGDLRQRGRWSTQLSGIEAVAHLAASTSGDLGTQVAGTVLATEHLLDALGDTPLGRFVHISSFAVYDHRALPGWSVLDERSPIEATPRERDPYTMTKLAQERLVRAACARHGTSLVVLRPGLIYGPGMEWSHGAALTSRRLAAIIAPSAPLPLTYVANCADAVVGALTNPDADGATVNIVDDDLPTRAQYFAMCRAAGATTRHPIAVPFPVVDALGRTLRLANRGVFGGRMRLPELLDHRRQHARWKPLSYSNASAKALLGWEPATTIADGVGRMVAARSR